jgi:hypothetical protein
VRIAAGIAAHPGGSLPEEMKGPTEREALYHLIKCPTVTRHGAPRTHCQRSRSAIASQPGADSG